MGAVCNRFALQAGHTPTLAPPENVVQTGRAMPLEVPHIIGFLASSILLATLAQQVWKQWSSGKSEGVSPWLFAGQALANVGMLAYSILLGDVVFIVTNSATLATSCLGLAVQMRHAAPARRDDVTLAAGAPAQVSHPAHA